MAWWNRLFSRKRVQTRELSTQQRKAKVDLDQIDKVKPVSLRQLNDKDKQAIKKIESELIKSGVLAPREEEIQISDRIDEIITAVNKKGLENVRSLIGDEELDAQIALGEGSGNLILDDFDEYEDLVYDGYNVSEESEDSISVSAENSDGGVSLRLPDGRTIFGKLSESHRDEDQ